MKILVFLVIFFIFGNPVQAQKPSADTTHNLVEALIQVESSGNDWEIGDKKLVNKAYGCLQIRKPCLDDVNEMCGTNYTVEDCLGNRELSIWIFHRYMERWATKKRIGREPTDEDRARIWNRGPNGWKKKSTLVYWKKVKGELEKQKELEKKKGSAKK